MNFEYFIAKRIIFSKSGKGTISAPIIKIAIIAIALGIVMMLIAIATGTGLQVKIREKVSAFNGHIQIFNYDTNHSEVSVTPISIHQDFYPNFKQIPEITHIQAVATKGGIIRTEDTFEGIIAKGVGKDYEWKYMRDFLTFGRLPDFTKEQISDEILISDYLANRLKLHVGDRCNTLFLKDEKSSIPNQRNFKIVGTFTSGFQDFDASYIFTDLRQIQRINKWDKDQIGNFELFVDDFSKIKEISKQVYGNTSSMLDSQSIIDKYYFIFEWLKMFDFNIVLIIGIMIIVGGINMITALLVLILERTPMIGMLKALGCQNPKIRKIFLYNAGYLISKGIFWGNLIGIGLLLIQKYMGIIKLNPSVYYVSQVPVNIDITIVLLLNLGVFILCMAMLLIPSYIVTKIRPVKALKFD